MKAFEKIIGYEAVKKELMQISDSLANGEVYEKLGVKPSRGLLLHGYPGVGKTLMAGVVIEASGRKAFVCRKDKPDGDFVDTIRQTFEEAKKAAPSIVFLDDMDKFANGDERHRDAEEYVTVQSCIDDVRDMDVFVLATVNNMRVLPHSLLRAGRFDRIICIKTPTGEDAVNIIKYYMGQKKFVEGIDPVKVVAVMDGHSCAELENLINEAGLYAGYERADRITMDHFMKAYLHIVHNVPTEELNGKRTVPDLDDPKDKKTVIIYHEAGHAAVAEALEPGSVTLVSAYNGRGGSGGFTSYNRDRNRTITPDIEYGHIAATLAGMAAVEQKFGFVDLGNSEDLNSAYVDIQNLIEANAVCGFGLRSGDYTSPDLSMRTEQAVSVEAERLYRRAKQILFENRKLFEGIARALSEKCVVTAEDIKKIKEACVNK